MSKSEIMIASKVLEAPLSIWAIADNEQKQGLMRRFLAMLTELTSKNDFVGFLAAEYEVGRRSEGVGTDSPGGLDRALGRYNNNYV